MERKWTKELHKWIGFDIEEYDYVQPYGKGKVTDFEIFYDWNGVWDKNYDGNVMKVRFVQKYSGCYYADRPLGSDLVGVYEADVNANYGQEFTFSEKGFKDARGRVVRWERNKFDQNKVWVGRSRCVIDEDGKLRSARYFQIAYFRFACSEKGSGIKFVPYYNPVPNDTNLEPKR